jgi:hypothetical protein
MKERGVRKLMKWWHNRVASEPECANVTLLVAPDGPTSEQRREP